MDQPENTLEMVRQYTLEKQGFEANVNVNPSLHKE